MASVAKVNSNVRVTELDALSDAMEREYKAACAGGETAVGKDAVLAGLFAQLTDLSARNTTAIKQDAVVSTLEEADGRRDAITRDLFTLTNGYTASPFAEVKAAAKDVCATLDKYGRGMASKGYAEPQDSFAAAHDAYVKAKAGKGESATSLKKPLVSLINDGIVPYLNIVAAMEGYADFITAIAGNIKSTNDTVTRRAAGK